MLRRFNKRDVASTNYASSNRTDKKATVIVHQGDSRDIIATNIDIGTGTVGNLLDKWKKQCKIWSGEVSHTT